MRVAAILVATCLVGCAGRAWSRTDWTIGATVVVASAADWRQTRDITRHCDEINPIMGTCGQRVPVDLYFPAFAAAMLVAAHVVPSGPWRTAVLAAFAGSELTYVYSNMMQGEWPR